MSRDFKESVQAGPGDTPTVALVCAPPIEHKMPPITINDPCQRRILSVGISKLEATFTKVYWKQNLASERDRQRIIKLNGYKIEIYKRKGGEPVKVLNTRDVINVYEPSINPRCPKRGSALDIIAYEANEKQTRYLITLQMEKNPSVAAYACREMFTGLHTAIQHGFLDVILTHDGEKAQTEELKHQYVILRPPNLHFYDSFTSLKETRQPISLQELQAIQAPSSTEAAVSQFENEAQATAAFDLVFKSGLTLTLAASKRHETEDEDEVHSNTLADILRSWRTIVPRTLVNSDFRFTRYFLKKEREVGFGFVLGLRPPEDRVARQEGRAPYPWEAKPQIRVVMLTKYKTGVLGPSGRAGIRLNDVVIAINGDTKIKTISDCARHLKGSLEAYVDVMRLPLHENVSTPGWEEFGDETLKSIYMPSPSAANDSVQQEENDGSTTPDEEEIPGEPGEMPLQVADAVEASVRQSMAWRRASLMAEGELPLPIMAGGTDPTSLVVNVSEGDFLGIELAWDSQLNFPIVKGFTTDGEGNQGILEIDTAVDVGMVLGTINGQATFNTNLEAVLKKLEELPRPLQLEFMPMDPADALATVDEEVELEELGELEGVDADGAEVTEAAFEPAQVDQAELLPAAPDSAALSAAELPDDGSLAHVANLNLDSDVVDPVSAEFHDTMLSVIETEGAQYLAIRNGLVSKLGRKLESNEKEHIKRHLGRLELQRIATLEDERQFKLAQIGAEGDIVSPADSTFALQQESLDANEASAAGEGEDNGGDGGGQKTKKRGGRKKVRKLPPRTKPPGMSPEEWRRLLSTLENNVQMGPSGDYEMFNKTRSGRYKRIVVDLAQVAGQKFAAGLITQEQYDSIVDDLDAGKTVVGDIF